MKVVLLLLANAIVAYAQTPPSPPSIAQTANINWSLLATVLGSLWLFTMLAVVLASCICRSTNNAADPSQVHVEAGLPAGSLLHTQPAGIFTARKVERARSWRAGPNPNNAVELSSIERSIKMGFVRKVYSILATQLALTVAIVMGFVYCAFEMGDGGAPDARRVTAFGDWMLSNYWVMLVMFIPTLIIICALQSHKNSCASTIRIVHPHCTLRSRCSTLAPTDPGNFVLLFIFTCLSSVDLGFFCVFFYRAGYGSEILLAFAITMAIFCVLTLFTMQSKIDWSFLGPSIFCCLFIMIFCACSPPPPNASRTARVASAHGAFPFASRVVSRRRELVHILAHASQFVRATTAHLPFRGHNLLALHYL